MMREALAEAERLVRLHSAKINRVAHELTYNGVLYEADIIRLLGDRTIVLENNKLVDQEKKLLAKQKTSLVATTSLRAMTKHVAQNGIQNRQSVQRICACGVERSAPPTGPIC
jgi:hypothetical protein